MLFIPLKLIIVAIIVGKLQGQKRCNSSYCNYEGTCEFLNGSQKKCTCLPKVSRGDTCEELIDACGKDLCKKQSKCKSFPGGFNCECKPGYHSYYCDQDSTGVTPLQDPMFAWNRIVESNKKEAFLLTTSQIGNLSYNIVFSPLESCGKHSLKTDDMTKAKNIRKICNDYGIRSCSHLPQEEGFYAAFENTFRQVQEMTCTVKVLHSVPTLQVLAFLLDFQLRVEEETIQKCIPRVILSGGHTLEKPVRLRTDLRFVVSPLIESGCPNLGTSFTFEYQLQSVQKEVLHTFPLQTTKDLIVEPYQLNTFSEDELLVVFLKVTEVIVETGHKESVEVSSYVLSTAPLQATIDGGLLRQVKEGTPFTLNGKSSKDLRLVGNVNQNLHFHWRCKSDDSQNGYCNDFSKEEQEVVIPKHVLNLGQSYSFELTISKHNRTASTSQTIEVVNYDPLHIEIKCIKNCKEQKSNIDHFIHLQVVCRNCFDSNDQIEYQWMHKEATIGTDYTLIYEFNKQLEQTTLAFEVTVKVGERFGKNIFTIEISSLNKDISCQIEPTKGVPLLTPFKLVCDDVQIDEGLSLNIYQNGIFLLETQQHVVDLFLVDSGQTEPEIRVVIKNLYGSRVERKFTVQLEEFLLEPSSVHLQKFIDNTDHQRSIRGSMNIGDHVQAFGIFNTIVANLNNLEDAEERFHIAEKMLTTVESFLKIHKNFNPLLLNSAFKHLTEQIDTPHQISSKISDVLAYTTSLLINLNEDEILENAKNIADTINNILEPFDELTEPYDDYVDQPDEPFTEHYPDYGELEVNVIVKYMNLERLVLNVEATLETFTEALVTVMDPLEPARVILSSNSKHYFRIINFQSVTSLTQDMMKVLGTKVELDQTLVNELNQKTKVGMCVSYFRNNPYWWYPNKYANVTGVHMVSMIEQGMENLEEKKFIHNLKYPIKVFTNLSSDLVSEVSGVVEHLYDMPSYRFLANMNDTLDFRFAFDTETPKVNIGFTLNRRPKRREVGLHIHNALMYNTESLYANSKQNFVHMALANTKNVSTVFKFSTTFLSCLEWNKETSHWTTVHSEIGGTVNDTLMECHFSHLSTLGISQHKPLVKEDPTRTFPHVLEENQVVVYLIAIMLVTFVAMMTWAFVEDRKDVKRRSAIVLADNSPLHNYEYLVIIQTGSDPRAGTTSRLGIQLIGEVQTSQKHLLCTPGQDLFQRFSENAVIIRTLGPLGRIKQVLLWHNNSGTNPSWYCHSIIVRDTLIKQEFPFLVEQWISLLQTDQTFAYISLPTEEQYYNKHAIIRSNQLFVMQNQVWPYNLLYKHPRSSVARTEMILCGFQQLFVPMLVNIVLYGKSTKDNLEDEEEQYHHVGHYDTIFLYSMISLGVCLVINYPMKYLMEHSSLSKVKMEEYRKVFRDNDVHSDQTREDVQSHTPWKSEVKILWYILSCTICFTSIAIIITYGYNFGNVKFLMWTVSVCIQLAKSYFITAPILTYITLHHFPRNTKQRFDYYMPSVIKKTEEKLRSKLEMLRIHAASKVNRFNDKCYVISSGLTKNAKKLTYQKYELRELVSDLLMFLTFFVTLNVLILGTRDSNTYYSTKMIENMFVNGLFSPMRLADVKVDGQFWDYLNKTFIPVMHSGSEHNKAKVEKELGWLPGKFLKILGVAQIRQIRIKDSDCQRSYLTQQTTCQSNYVSKLRDTENYYPNWTTFQAFNYESSYWRLIRPWKYKVQSFFDSPPIFAKEHWYAGGGYVAQLGRTLNNTRKVSHFLQKHNWIDARTRVVFIEFTIYNVDADIFNVVILMFERNAIGQWQTSYYIQSCKFLFRFSNMGTWFVIVFVLFVLLTGTFLLQLILKVFKETLRIYIKKIWNLTDSIIVVMSVQVVMLFIKRNDYVEDLLKEVGKTKNNEFVSFELAATLDTIISYVSGILICVATIRLWKILLFAQVFRLFTNTLYHACYAILSCAILILIFLMGYSGCIYLINGANSEVLHNLWTVLPAITAVSFGMEPFDLQNIMYGGETLGIILFIVMLTVITLFLVNMFITVIIFYFKKSKDDEQNERRLYTLSDFIKDRMKRLKNPFVRKGYHDLKSKSTKTRLRAGQEQQIKCIPGKITDIADTVDAQLTYLEEYFKEFGQKKKKHVLNHIKTLHSDINTHLNALRINIEAKITVYEAESDTDSS